MKKFVSAKIAAAAVLSVMLFGAGIVAGAARFGKPKSVIHVVTVKWKEGTTPDQIKAAVDGVDKVAAAYPGIKNVWTRAIKVQGAGYTHAFAMEFESEEALQKYAGSDAQKEWYKAYLPVRGQSTTHDITN
ncbi:MAG: Dabb family protein [Bryobacterales bacterium]|nr:Dabb family protein [Bryobacterales bacterium]